MCGIFGFVGQREYAESVDLDRAIRSLDHRGPDDRGIYRSVSRTDPDLACAFAHTRLAIQDLSPAGHQPMTTEDGRYTVNFNGEIYNFSSLRSELERSGQRFASRCDTEVVLKGFAAWGEKCVVRFRGIFAFAIWDHQESRLFIARDHLGVKPLYYSQTSKALLFASEVRTLLGTGSVERRMSPEGLSSYLSYGSVQDPLTILENVYSLMPGHYAFYENGLLSIQRYWHVSTEVDSSLTFEGAVERVRPVLQEAVALQMVADVPLGIFLSGGVDSSALVALASASSSSPIHTFTVTFDEPAFNEERYASEVARVFGSDHHQVRLPGSRVVREFDRFIGALDQPSADGVNTYFVAEAAREAGLAVALSGSGGDELFAGYDHFRTIGRTRAISRHAGSLARPLRGLLDRFPAFGVIPNRLEKLIALLEARGGMQQTYASLRAMFTPRQLAHLKPGTAGSFQDRAEVVEGPDDVVNYSAHELTGYLPNTLLRDTDVMSMAHSLEVRVPLLDHELVSCVAAVPGHLKLGSTSKPLLIAACGSLPPQVSTRRKMGFTLPMDVWFRGALRSRIAGILDDSRVERVGILDPSSVRSLWQSFLRGSQYVSWSRVWTVAALLEWSERHDAWI